MISQRQTLYTTLTILLIVLFFLPLPSFASTFSAGLNNVISVVGGTVGLPNITVDKLIGSITAFVTGLAVALTTLAIVIGGIMYTLAWGDESKASRAKSIITYAIIGYAVVLIVDMIKNAVISLRGGTPGAEVATPFVIIINHVAVFVYTLIGVLAVLAIILGAYQYLTSFGDESKSARGKQTIIYAITALIITGLTYPIIYLVGGIIAGPAATVAATEPFTNLLINTVTAILTPLALIAVIALVYGGYTYITAAGDEQKTSTAKKAIIYAIAGIMLIMISAAIVNIVVAL